MIMIDTIQQQNELELEEFEQNQVILSPGQLVLKRFFRNKLATIGIVIIAAMLLFCWAIIISIWEYEIFYINKIQRKRYPCMIPNQSRGNRSYTGTNFILHWLGTGADRRDVLTRLMYGEEYHYSGLMVVLVELIIGVT